jgi:hypothetical protein
VVDE